MDGQIYIHTHTHTHTYIHTYIYIYAKQNIPFLNYWGGVTNSEKVSRIDLQLTTQ